MRVLCNKRITVIGINLQIIMKKQIAPSQSIKVSMRGGIVSSFFFLTVDTLFEIKAFLRLDTCFLVAKIKIACIMLIIEI